MKFQGNVTLTEQRWLNEDVFRFTVNRPEEITEIKAGQFFNIKTNQYSSPLLRRPISVSGFTAETIEFTVKLMGEGTRQLSKFEKGEQLDIMGPLGNGFAYKGENKVLLIGGGIGIAPIKGLLEAIKTINPEAMIDVILGFRDAPFLENEFKDLVNTCTIVSENDSRFENGFVTEPFTRFMSNDYDMIFSCGPEAMLKALTSICNDNNLVIQLLMEEKMACGIGACLVCTCKVKEGDLGFKHVRMCKEGPMFYGSEVIFNA
jgi:dihydroorotate dehydrogenase electron transfer subunit